LLGALPRTEGCVCSSRSPVVDLEMRLCVHLAHLSRVPHAPNGLRVGAVLSQDRTHVWPSSCGLQLLCLPLLLNSFWFVDQYSHSSLIAGTPLPPSATPIAFVFVKLKLECEALRPDLLLVDGMPFECVPRFVPRFRIDWRVCSAVVLGGSTSVFPASTSGYLGSLDTVQTWIV